MMCRLKVLFAVASLFIFLVLKYVVIVVVGMFLMFCSMRAGVVEWVCAVVSGVCVVV